MPENFWRASGPSPPPWSLEGEGVHSDEVLCGQGWIRRGWGEVGKRPSLEKRDLSQVREKGELEAEGGPEHKKSRTHQARPISEKGPPTGRFYRVSREVHNVNQYLLAEPLAWPGCQGRSLEI